jgi:hypothetical protein
MSNYHNNGMKELSAQFIRKKTDYRPITLLNIAYKIYALLLNKRLIEKIENKQEDHQMGFSNNRSIIDNIFIVRQIYEKSHEHNIDLYNIFVGETHAFDSVYRNKLKECLKKFNVQTN